ncbi:MAG: helix-turn-helix transcriptional regulator [Burkholderia gladioli]
MQDCNYYLDLAKTRRGLSSDYALSKALGASSTSVISNYRNGRSHFDDTMAIKVAALCEVDPLELIAVANYSRARSDDARAVWSALLEKISKGFRWLALPANACGAMAPQV